MIVSLFFARIVTFSIALLMLMASWSPLLLAAIYLILRPLLYPYTNLNYNFYGGFPLSGLLSLALIIPVFANSIIKKNFSLYISGQMAFYLFIISTVPSMTHAESFEASIAMFIKLVTGLGFAILIKNSLSRPEKIYKVFTTFAYASIIPLIFAYYEKFTGFVWIWKQHHLDVGRVDSIFGRWNEYGIFLCLIICVLIALILIEKKRGRKVFWILMAGAATVSLIHSFNRGSWIALVVAILVACLAYYRRIQFRWLAISMIVISILFGSIVMSRFERLESKDSYGMSQNTLDTRVNYWIKIKDLVIEKPIVGWGIGNAEVVTSVRLRSKLPPHNDYLRVLFETGILGFIAWILYLFVQLYYAFKWCANQERWRINMPVLVCIIYFSIILLTQNIITHVVILPLFMGIMAAAHRWNLLISLQESKK